MSKGSKYPVDLTKFKPVKFEIEKHVGYLVDNTIIVFKYGINLPHAYNMMGKIVKVHTSEDEKTYIDIITKDRGLRTTIPDMIEKIYIPKEKIADKENRIKCITNGNSVVPRLDAAIDKVIFKIKNILPDLTIINHTVNDTACFSRHVYFNRTNQDSLITDSIKLILENKDTEFILVVNSKKTKDKKVGVTKYGIDTWSIVQQIKEL